MSPENKQRIVGAIVLVAFVALLIPFLFTSGLKKESANVPTAATSVVPVPAVTPSGSAKQKLAPLTLQNSTTVPIPISTSTQTQKLQPIAPAVKPQAIVPVSQLSGKDKVPEDQTEGLELPPATTVASASPTTPTPAVPATSQPPAPTLATNAMPVKKDEKKPAAATPEVKIVSTGEIENAQAPANSQVKAKAKGVKKVPAKISKAKVKKVAKKATPKVSSKVVAEKFAGKSFWAVQIGSFSTQDRVQKLTKELHAKGFRVYTQKVKTASGGTLTRIFVGHEPTKEQAQVVAKKLDKTMKFSGHVVRTPK